MAIATSVHEIKVLLLSLHPLVVIETVEEDRVGGILASVADQIGKPLFEWSMVRGLTRFNGDGDRIAGTTAPAALLKYLDGFVQKGIFLLKDLSPHLGDPAAARLFRELVGHCSERRSNLILVGASVGLFPDLEALAVRYKLRLPACEELNEVVTSVLDSLGKDARHDVELDPGDRQALLRALRGLTLNQARQAVAQAVLRDGKLTPAVIGTVLDRKAQLIREGGLLEYYPSQDNRYVLGGFANLKAWLGRARLGFSAEARKFNLTPPRGILIVGVPGCGKSLAAKSIAREWKLPLLKLDAGRLYDKFIGESEKNLRKAIELAESIAPAVLWIDEIEKGFAPSGGEADAGLSRRIFGTFLTWLQEKRHDVFVVATANDLSVLPPELLRKGRFDEIFFVDLPSLDERRSILEIQLKLRNQDPERFGLEVLSAACDGFSGAEIEQAVIGSIYRALALRREPDTAFILEEMRGTVPLSVSRREEIDRLRKLGRSRFVSVH